jgi:hypothetical protein
VGVFPSLGLSCAQRDKDVANKINVVNDFFMTILFLNSKQRSCLNH